jgi:hypothetical protein
MRSVIRYMDAPQHCLQVFLTSDPGSIQELCIWKEKTTEEWPALIIIGVLTYLSALAHIFSLGYDGFYAVLEGVLL